MNIIEFINKYKNNCFWLFIPVIIFNIIFTKYLPEFFLRNINHPIVIMETVAKIVTIAFSLIMAIKLDNKIGKIGFIVYIIGILIYFCSYFIVIKIQANSYNNNLLVLLAPYWTSALWLIGIGFIGNELLLNIPYHNFVYVIVSIVFVVIHSIHGYLCYNV